MAYLALDLGAGSGRAIVGSIKEGKIILDEVHRFTNQPIELGGTLYWDFLSLFANIKKGIRVAVQKGYKLKGIAVDTWGVDFGMIDKQGNLISNPVCYRDSRVEGYAERSASEISKSELYSRTGIQQMDLNTIFQLMSMRDSGSKALKIADRLLFMPDLINFYLTGKPTNEYTIASTSQLLNAESKKWDGELFSKLSLPMELMQEIVMPGSEIGLLCDNISEKSGAGKVMVYATGSHDTASAIGSIPMDGDNWAFLSSGTWSIMGVTVDKPVLTDDAMLHNFTNEGGVDNKILFMKNITGLWLLQRLISEWQQRGDSAETISYDYLLAECQKAEPFQSVVNTDDPLFNHPHSMTEAIQQFCRESGQTQPESKGELVRCVLESLAFNYHFVMEKLKESTDKQITKLYIVGGGSKNDVLNQFIADALNMEVMTGLCEGTAIGNLMQQAIASGEVADWVEGHKIIAKTFDSSSFLPKKHGEWLEAVQKIAHLF